MMPKKSKAELSKNAQTKLKERTEDLIDDDDLADVDFDDNGLIAQTPSKSDKRMIIRRRLEDYLEDRRLKKELSDDYDF